MKKFLLSIIIIVCMLIGFNTNANARIIDDNKNVEEIIVNVPSNILFYSGEEFEMNIRTYDAELYKSIKYEIKDNKLYIDFYDNRDLENNRLNPEDIKIYIQSPNEIKKIKTNSDLLVATRIKKNMNATNNEKN